jgi:predicted acylesterase/phospholipase RssA
MMRWAWVLSGTVMVLSCGGTQRLRDARWHEARRTCLVLSVGSFRGVAHLGAIQRVKESDVRIDCVVGNSMGALVGALYASAPAQDTTARFRTFRNDYERTSRADASDRGFGTGLLVGLLTIATGGTAALALGLGAGGYVAGASSVDPVNHARVVRVLQRQLGSSNIEGLSIPFVTGHAEREHDGLRARYVTRGNLAQAVGDSIANPFLFGDVNIRAAQRLDPGGDHEDAVPVDEACRRFPDSRLLVVNVTGRESLRTAGMNCPVVEVMVPRVDVSDEVIARGGSEFDQVVRAGYEATGRALDGDP